MLENRNKNNPFSVPENYFQNFNAEIMNQLPVKEINNKKIVPLWKKISRWTAVAAAVTGLALVGIHYTDTANNTARPPGTAVSAVTAYTDDSEALENDYYLFLEEEAARIAYQDALYYE